MNREQFFIEQRDPGAKYAWSVIVVAVCYLAWKVWLWAQAGFLVVR